MEFIVKPDFWELFPEAKIGIVIARGIDNHPSEPQEYQRMLDQACETATRYFVAEVFSENPVIKVWREAFQKFKTKKGARSSIEALLKRVQGGGGIGGINPLVDLYNSVSLEYGLPCGGEDISAFVGDVRLTMAEGDEAFVTLGSLESAPPYPGEIVYKDDAGAICRCWNWRESVRTMLQEETKDAFLCIETVDPSREEAFQAALSSISTKAANHLGGTCRIEILSKDHPEMQID